MVHPHLVERGTPRPPRAHALSARVRVCRRGTRSAPPSASRCARPPSRSARDPGREDREDLPGATVVDHEPQRPAGRGERPHLRERPVGVRCVVDHPERVDEVEVLARERRCELLRVRLRRTRCSPSTPITCARSRAIRSDSPERSTAVTPAPARAKLIDVGADAAADLEHALAAPALELARSRGCAARRSTCAPRPRRSTRASRPASPSAGCCTGARPSSAGRPLVKH